MVGLTRPLRVGILGAGTIASVHAANLDQMSEAQLVAVADTDLPRAQALAAPRGIAAEQSLDQLLENHALEAVLVCLPPFATSGVVAQLAGRGLHVYAEKPVGLELRSALEDLARVRETGVVAASGYMWRASPIVVRARTLLDGRTAGLVQGTVITAPPPPPWWREKARSGGILVELATHVVDLLCLFGGEPGQVSCRGARRLLGNEWASLEDVVAATITFRSGAVGSLSVACGTGGGRWAVDVVAPELHLALSFFPERLTGHAATGPIDFTASPDPTIQPHGFSGAVSWYCALRQFVLAALAERPEQVAASFEDGVRTLALTLACEQSLAAGGVPIEVPVVT